MEYYGHNDWRDYLMHNWGTSPEMKQKEHDYNAKYYQEHKEEILKKLHERRRSPMTNPEYEERFHSETQGRDYNKYDWGGREFDKAYTAEGKRAELLRYANTGAFSDFSEWEGDIDELNANNNKHTEYSADVLRNIMQNNQNVLNNMRQLAQNIEAYVKAHQNEMTTEQIGTLYQQLDQQMALEEKRFIDLDSSEGKSYVDDLLGGAPRSSGGGSGSKSSGSSGGGGSSNSSNKASSNPSWYDPKSDLGVSGGSGGSSRSYRSALEEEQRRRRG